jgi:hypothetical protein
VLGNCGVTNQVAGAQSAAMMCWCEGYGWDDAMAREEKFKNHCR